MFSRMRVFAKPLLGSELLPWKAEMNDTLRDALSCGVRPDPAHWIGKPASDFELPLLQQRANENGETSVGMSSEKIRLSSFRGKKVVCLFLSSYT